MRLRNSEDRPISMRENSSCRVRIVSVPLGKQGHAADQIILSRNQLVTATKNQNMTTAVVAASILVVILPQHKLADCLFGNAQQLRGCGLVEIGRASCRERV